MNHQENNNQLPSYMYRFFWEYDQQKIDIHKHCDLIMTRIMARGNWQSMVWLRKIYSVNRIKKFLFGKGWKVLPLRELNYWALVGGVSDQQRKELLRKARKTNTIWRDRIVH